MSRRTIVKIFLKQWGLGTRRKQKFECMRNQVSNCGSCFPHQTQVKHKYFKCLCISSPNCCAARIVHSQEYCCSDHSETNTQKCYRGLSLKEALVAVKRCRDIRPNDGFLRFALISSFLAKIISCFDVVSQT